MREEALKPMNIVAGRRKQEFVAAGANKSVNTSQRVNTMETFMEVPDEGVVDMKSFVDTDLIVTSHELKNGPPENNRSTNVKSSSQTPA